MEPEYIECVINDRRLKFNKNNSLDIWIWRDYYITIPKWVKKKATLTTDKKTKYTKYKFIINNKNINLSRAIYKAHNPQWDITDVSRDNEIDHINRDSTDNRIENLRVLTHSQNCKNTTSKGYYWSNQKNKWLATIKLNYVDIYLGVFDKEEDARQAYLNAKEVYHII